ncbi:MAG: efflux RND transporter periplasmic adaptor subunit [bacterium]
MKKLIGLFFIATCVIICLVIFRGVKFPKVRIITPTISKIDSCLLTTGTIDAQLKTEICAKAKGVVDKVLVEENNNVTSGQELIIFNQQEAEKMVKEAQSQLDLTKRILIQAEQLLITTTGLYGKQEVLEDEVKNSESAYKKALVEKNISLENLRLAQEQLNNLIYLAPHSGTVIEKRVLPGQYVLQNEVLMKIVDLEKLQVSVNLLSIDARRVKLGQDASIKLEDLELSGYVKSIQPEEVSSKVIIELDTSKKLPEIKLGKRVEVKILTEHKENVVLLDSEAIFKEGRQSFVYLYKDGVATKRVVRIGITNQNQTEIIFGLTPQDKIILSAGSLKLKEGMKVRE